TQSFATAHFLPVGHCGQVPPPQSVSVSAPFFTLSPHWAGEHLNIWLQTMLAQSPSTTHSTHAESEVHFLPPPSEHPAPTGFAVWVASPLSHASSVHSFLSSSTSASSAMVTSAPMPSHWTSWQSPAVWRAILVPAAEFWTPQKPALHVRFWQGPSM